MEGVPLSGGEVEANLGVVRGEEDIEGGSQAKEWNMEANNLP